MRLTRARGDLQGADPFLKQRLEREALVEETCSLCWPDSLKVFDPEAKPDDPIHTHRCKLRPGHITARGEVVHLCGCGMTTVRNGDRSPRSAT